jgi:DNA-binding IscR family transcriptional regulator
LIEGPIVLKPCLFQNHSCIDEHHAECVFGAMIMGFESDVLRFLKTTTLASVAAKCTSGAGR